MKPVGTGINVLALLPVERLCRATSGEYKVMWPSSGTVFSAASLVYRLPASWVGPKLPWKVLHAALHLLAFTVTVVGLTAVFGFHNHSKITHLYSLHSWLGITTVALFACQVGASASSFPVPVGSVCLGLDFTSLSSQYSLCLFPGEGLKSCRLCYFSPVRVGVQLLSCFLYLSHCSSLLLTYLTSC